MEVGQVLEPSQAGIGEGLVEERVKEDYHFGDVSGGGEDVFTENAIQEGEHFFNVLRRAVREGATEDDHQAVVTHNVFWPSLPPIDEGTAHEIAPPPVTPVPPILPTMSTLSINCLLLGTDSSKVFVVEIPKTKNVSILKRLIKEEQSPDLNHVTASKLIVWKVSLPADTISPELTLWWMNMFTFWYKHLLVHSINAFLT
ncbi:hypothetical protein B0F90DRAFT_1672569 [Multifurca ochricompacta]|uniref:Crinkler effector protein N-terminal domain-containing protein n=1 Tax=Multifurca ochricompacta TaxID=376703 RepID=A0AAD4LU26_9AGAM|nr:hypothetical protein B0F90DRAFT_1672569 [Multifurca ochricompacta]